MLKAFNRFLLSLQSSHHINKHTHSSSSPDRSVDKKITEIRARSLPTTRSVLAVTGTGALTGVSVAAAFFGIASVLPLVIGALGGGATGATIGTVYWIANKALVKKDTSIVNDEEKSDEPLKLFENSYWKDDRLSFTKLKEYETKTISINGWNIEGLDNEYIITPRGRRSPYALLIPMSSSLFKKFRDIGKTYLDIVLEPNSHKLYSRSPCPELKAIDEHIHEHADLLYKFSQIVEHADCGPVIRKDDSLHAELGNNDGQFEFEFGFEINDLKALEIFFDDLTRMLKNLHIPETTLDRKLLQRQLLYIYFVKETIQASKELLKLIPEPPSRLKNAYKVDH